MLILVKNDGRFKTRKMAIQSPLKL